MKTTPGGTYYQRLMDKLSGDPDTYSMGNRAFNFINAITFLLLVSYLAFDLFISQLTMSVVISGMMVVLGFLYYFSRFKKKYQVGIIIYALISYTVLILNYFINSGINGPTLCLFF